MASGKMSPRQKMINLMYLIFIAMLALNMDKEVLAAFGIMTEQLTESTISTKQKNEAAYQSLALQAKEQEAKFGPLKQKADSIRALSRDFNAYLADLKNKMQAEVDDPTAYATMDKSDFLDEYFFVGDDLKPEGQEFVNRVDNYREGVKDILGNNFPELRNTVQTRFKTDPYVNNDGVELSWIDYRYKGYPLVASLMNLTQLQSNIENTESDVLSTLLQGEQKAQLSLSNYNGIVRLDKTAYFAGEQVKGEVVLGRYDATLVPDKVTLNGKDATNLVQNGQVIIDMPAGNVGQKTIKGTITFTQDGEPVNVPFESEYSVIAEPSSAVVSADKMNVVYRGLDNPISVSLPGVGSSNLRVSATGATLVKNGNGYILRPGSGDVATVNVSATLSSGNTVNTPATFRIKDIPAAQGSVRGQYGTVRMPASGLANAPIAAGLPDFEFDLNLEVTSFKIKVPGELTVINNGSTLSAAAKKVLSKAKRGDMVNIYDIKARVVNSNYELKQVLPVNIDIIN